MWSRTIPQSAPSKLLRADGATVWEARTGRQALKLAREKRPDLVVLDGRLPDRSGREVCRQIKAEAGLADVFVVLVSGEAPDAAHGVGGSEEAQADDFLVAPLAPAEFVARIRMLLRLRAATVALRAREQRYRRLIEILPDAVGLIDLQGRVLTVNPQGLAMSGYPSAEELLAKSIFDLTPAAEHKRLKADLARTLQAGVLRAAEYTMLRKNGRRYSVEMSIAVLKDGPGQPRGLVGVVRDITGRKRAQQRLTDALTLTQTVLTASSVGILVYHSSGQCLFANEAAGLIACASVEQLLRQNFRRIASWRNCGLLAMAEETLRQGGLHVSEVHTVTTFGKEVWLDCRTARLVFDGDSHLLLLTTEITDRKRAEESVRVLSRRLWQAQDEERRRIARELHDSVGQKLAALTMILGAVEDQVSGAVPRCRKEISESLAMIGECAHEIRTLSYLLHPPFLEELGLAGALRSYCERLSKRIGLRVTLDVPETVGRLPAEVELALFRVVQEALSNVQRHSGGRSARLRLTHRADQVWLEVSDRGRGIPAARLKAVLQGTAAPGLGIVSMRERLRQLNGRVGIRSRRKGTTVRAILPLPVAPP